MSSLLEFFFLGKTSEPIIVKLTHMPIPIIDDDVN